MKSPTAMQQSCSRGPRQLILSSIKEWGKNGEEEEITSAMQSFVAVQQSCRGSGRGMKKRKKWWGGGEQGGGVGEEEEEEITTAMQFSTAIQQSSTRGSRQLFLYTVQGGGR